MASKDKVCFYETMYSNRIEAFVLNILNKTCNRGERLPRTGGAKPQDFEHARSPSCAKELIAQN